MAVIYQGKRYRSYKHPILEHILQQALQKAIAEGQPKPDEVAFTYADISQAMIALGMQRDAQASLSNFVLDLLRKENTHEDRVPDSVIQLGYDLARMPDRKARQGLVGRLVRKELLPASAWINWDDVSEQDTITLANLVPSEILPYLGKDEGALLSVIDYCDLLSQALIGTRNTIKRVQHPKKWQPGEVDGLYFSDYNELPTLYPIEAKALSTGDAVNLEQVQGAYNTISVKISNVNIVPLAIAMTPLGMNIAVFEVDSRGFLGIVRKMGIILDNPIETWQPKAKKRVEKLSKLL